MLQGPTKVIMVCNTLPYGHAPTYQISLTYLERQKCCGPDKKILFKKQLFDLEVKVPTKVIVSQSEITDNRHVIKAIYRKNVILVRYYADFSSASSSASSQRSLSGP
jgi:hypothetical protein